MFNRIVQLKFSINWLRWIIYAAFILIIAYIFFPRWHDVLVFVAAVLGGIGVLISAMNEIDARREEIAHGQARTALRFIADWNSPDFYHAKNKGRELLDHFEKNGIGDCEFLDQRLQNLMDVLNFFEELSIAIQLGMPPENTRGFKVGSFTERRRTDESEPFQRGANYRGVA